MPQANGNGGFTLIEMMLVVVIIAATSSLVVMALPSNSSQKHARERLAALADAIPVQRMEAMAQGALFGLRINALGYQFMVRDPAGSHGWKALSASEPAFAEGITLQLTQQDLLLDDSPSAEQEGKPQLLLFPGGEVTPFELTAFDQKQALATLSVTESGETRLVDSTSEAP